MKVSDYSIKDNVTSLDYTGKAVSDKRDAMHTYHNLPLPVHQFMAHKFSIEEDGVEKLTDSEPEPNPRQIP